MSRQNAFLAALVAATLLLISAPGASALSGIMFLNPGMNHTVSAPAVEIENAATNALVATADVSLTFTFKQGLYACGFLNHIGDVMAAGFANVVPAGLAITPLNLPWRITSPRCELLFILNIYALPISVLGVRLNIGGLGNYTGSISVGMLKNTTVGNLSTSCQIGVLDSLFTSDTGTGPALKILLPQLFNVSPCVPFLLLL